MHLDREPSSRLIPSHIARSTQLHVEVLLYIIQAPTHAATQLRKVYNNRLLRPVSDNLPRP